MVYGRGGRREIAPLYRAGRGQKFIYGGYIGYIFLKILISRFVSRIIGAYLDSPLSRMHIKKFIRKNGLDMSQFDAVKYKSFNDFFTRRVKGECRPVDLSGSSFISPCDGYLSVYPVSADGTFNVKGFNYTVGSLFKSDEITRKFMGGLCLVFRLTVKDYHRYIYLDDCEKGENVFIKGKLHTVQPVALESLKVYTENCREYTFMRTQNFGEVAQIEVGAMGVGRIKNNHGSGKFKRGEEKGKFEYGGSTIVVLIKRDSVVLDEEFAENTKNGWETAVKCGERIGVAAVN